MSAPTVTRLTVLTVMTRTPELRPVTDSGRSTRQNSGMPASAYSPGLAKRSVRRVFGLTTSTIRPTLSRTMPM